MINYNRPPYFMGKFEIKAEEYFSYTYFPSKLSGQVQHTLEPRLKIFEEMIGRASCDFIGKYGLDRFVESNAYVTAKSLVQRAGQGFNRTGWHSDGFMTEDVSYIWSNIQPTVFNRGDFFLTQDDTQSILDMEAQAKPENNFSPEDGMLTRMDQFTIHKVGDYVEGHRVFFKLSFSLDKYNLKGNSINYDLDYNWDYVERKKYRNIPQQM